MDYKAIAEGILAGVGGKENVKNVMHCATRLRIQCKDESKIDENKVTDVEAVKGVFNAKNQFQIILGSGTVNLVYDEFIKLVDIDTNQAQDTAPEQKDTSFKGRINAAVKTLSDVFVPIIPAIVAGGLLMGINNVLSSPIFNGMTLVEAHPALADYSAMIDMFSNAAFTFLPVLIGFSATQKFGGNPYLGASLGMIMVHPNLLNAYNYHKIVDGVMTQPAIWHVFGMNVEAVGYQGTVLPILVMSWILAKIEVFLHKHTASWLDNLTTPLLSILLSGFICFMFVGPVMRAAGNGITAGITWMYNTLGAVGAGLFGLLYAPIVITGMHHSFIAVETQLIADLATSGGSFIFTTACMSNVAQGAAVLTILATTKDEKLKSLCSASGISALLGITEPAMFGVNLKLKYPFYAAMIGSAVGSAWCGAFRILAQAMGAAGIPGFISMKPSDWGKFAVGLLLSMVASVLCTLALQKRQQGQDAADAPAEVDDNTVVAIADGELKNIGDSTDAGFNSKGMGDGYVLFPQGNKVKVYAPFNGKISLVFPTKHAIGIISNTGKEMLIHMGIDTVNLNGAPFEVFVAADQEVKAGQLLATMDAKAVKGANCSTEILCIYTAGDKPTDDSLGKVKAKQVIQKF